MVKAGSIAYALFICILVGIFCYALLLISGYSKLHQTMLHTHTELIQNNESAQTFFLSKIEGLASENSTTDLFENDIVSSCEVYPWGFYQILVTTSVFKKDAITRTSLIGKKQERDPIALYLSDAGKALFMVGKANIIGDVYLPKRGIKQGYITSNAYQNKNFLKGIKNVAKSGLPKIKNYDPFYPIRENYEVDITEIGDSIPLYNSFDNPTIIVKTSEIGISRKRLSGNIVLKSKDSIFIRNDNSLKDIIIEAPKIVFEKGFKGVLQVVAEELVVLQENAILRYPSGILMKNNANEKKEIILQKGSKLIGGIVMSNTGMKGKSEHMVTIDSDAEVIGDLYCRGNLQLKGNVVGSVYTGNFYLKTEASSYDNYIMNGTINRKELPEDFIGISLGTDRNERPEKYVVIKPI